jgi:hypothetical protein
MSVRPETFAGLLWRVKSINPFQFDTVTVSAREVPTLPSMSVAVAVSATEPFATVFVFHWTV